MNNNELQKLAKTQTNFNDFYNEFIYQTSPNRTIEKTDINKYVRISARTYGRDKTDQFNMSIPKTGRVAKVNNKSIIIEVKGELFKFPVDTLIFDITEYENYNRQDLENLYNKLRS